MYAITKDLTMPKNNPNKPRPQSTQKKPKKHLETFKKCDNLTIPANCRDRFDCARFNQCIRACTQSGSTALKGCDGIPRIHCMDAVCNQPPPVKKISKNC